MCVQRHRQRQAGKGGDIRQRKLMPKTPSPTPLACMHVRTINC